MKRWISSLCALGLALTLSALPNAARADHDLKLSEVDITSFGETLEFHVGAENLFDPASGEGTRVRVGVTYLGFLINAQGGVDSAALEIFQHGQINADLTYVGRIRTSFGIGSDPDVDPELDAFDASIQVITQDGVSIDLANRTLTLTEGSLGVIKLTRDRALNEEYVLIVRILDSNAKVTFGIDEAVSFYLGASLRGLGYRMKDYVNGETFHGLELGGVGGEAGLSFRLAPMTTLELGVGGDADVSFGESDGFAVQSDTNAYGVIRLNVKAQGWGFQLSADGGYRATHDTGLDDSTGTPYIGSRAAFS